MKKFGSIPDFGSIVSFKIMTGRIKAGFGNLIGNAGEYYVMAELLKRGYVAALAPRNAPAFDILVTNGPRTAKIRVKSKSESFDKWQWVVKKDGSIFRDLEVEADFTVLVNLATDHRDLAYYVIPTKTLNDWLVRRFEEWLSAPGKRGQPHNPSNKKRDLAYSQSKKDLYPYLNNWEGLWE